MRTIIVNANIITGDGITILPRHSLVIENGIIVELVNAPYLAYDPSGNIIDAKDGLVIPGIINHHSHGGTIGPFNVFCEKPLTWERVKYNLNRHLNGGTTTVVNACGWPTMTDIEVVNKLHPINVRGTTVHTPVHQKHSEFVDGGGLMPWHEETSVPQMLQRGAIAIGEVGAPCAAYGTPQINQELGKSLTVGQIQDIKQAALGLAVDPEAFDKGKVEESLRKAGLDDILDAEGARELMDRHVVQPYELTKDCCADFTRLSLEHDVALIFHNTPDTQKLCLEMAAKLGHRFIALHTNYSYPPDQAVECARELKRLGAYVDIFTADSFGAQMFIPSPETAWDLFKEGLVDMISTDYIAGYWDPIPLVLEMAIKDHLITLEKAVYMATRQVVEALPRLGDDRGLIKPGNKADLLVTEADHLSRIHHVLIGGQVVAQPMRRC
jgi:hypothetical protein